MASIGPGPAYSLPSTIGYEKHDQRKPRSPQYTMAARLKDPKVNMTPGPTINTRGFTRFGQATTYAYSIAPRTFFKDYKNIGPGPAQYDISQKPYVNKAAPPSYSLGRRNNFKIKNQSPGPNAYVVREDLVQRAAPGYSIGIKTVLKNNVASPGPANYPVGDLKLVMHKAPEYSLYSRTYVSNKSFVPGANAYNRTNYKPGKSSPAFSFGTRHSSKAPPMIVPCDNL